MELSYTYTAAGKKPEIQRSLSRVANVRVSRDSPSAIAIAEIYATSGNSNFAFQALEKGYRLRDGGLINLNADPNLDRLRSDPRFKDLTRRVRAP